MYPGQNPHQQQQGWGRPPPQQQQQQGWGQPPQQQQQQPGGWGQQPQHRGPPPQQGWGPQQPYPQQQQGWGPQPGGGGGGWGQQPQQQMGGNFQQQQQPYNYQASNDMWYGRQYGGNVQNHEMQNLQQWFWSVDSQRRGEINANDLLNALRYMGHNFSEQTSRLIMAVFDADHSGSISFNEFVPMFKFIQALKERFQQCDHDRTQMLSMPQTEEALRSEGFTFDQKTAVALFHKFARNSPGLTFEQFVELACFLGAVKSEFQWRDQQNSGRVNLSLGELVEIIANVSANRGNV
eukprot:gb/GECH01011531.1/.p1 GENE.gb/GECH01011531.1/~~gb/GECH01011531.1/.p1  ORF type:complete len:293 (+),score=72.63 gb/GECH01011531.1/:1-879(+)